VLAEKTSELQGGSTEKRLQRNEVKGGWSYILAPDGLRAGDVVQSFRAGIPDGMVEGWAELIKPQAKKTPAKAEAEEEEGGESSLATATRALGLLRTMTLKPGNVLPLNLIPPGTHIHNISMSPDGRMQLCRAAGTFAQVVAHHNRSGQALGGAEVLQMGSQLRPDGTREPQDGTVLVKLQSGEVRRLPPAAVATIGVVSNKEHSQKQIGKAGRNRWLGKRPKVRGLAMNACDHPHGGGRGKSKGNKHPRSQHGLLQGKRTRRPKDKDGNKQVVSERPRGRASKHVRK
jgi:ribosomal protein L2